MELNKIKQLENIKTIKSQESTCYIYKDVVYKIFNKSLSIKERLNTIKFFLENDIQNCPKIYDFIYHNNEIVGYSMQYYKKAFPLSKISKFNSRKEKCLELIDVYSKLKDDNNFCYIDFNNNNIFVNNNDILLLDIDNCLEKNFQSEYFSNESLKEFVISIIYKTYFFDCETYFTSLERERIRCVLCRNLDGESIETESDLKKFLSDINKRDMRKVLRNIPYKIR